MFYLIHDEECWLCRNAATYAKIYTHVSLQLIPARSYSDWREYVEKKGYNINKGAILVHTQASTTNIYQGKQVVTVLRQYVQAQKSKNSGYYQKIHAFVYTSCMRLFMSLVYVMYPLLTGMRKILLWGKGVSHTISSISHQNRKADDSSSR